MPHKPPTFCKFSGCPNLCEIGETYCTLHRQGKERAYDQRRGTASQRGYGSRWGAYSKRFLAEHPMCNDGCGRASAEVDHIIPAQPGDPLFWDQTNHQALSKTCHSQKTARENKGFGNKRVNVSQM